MHRGVVVAALAALVPLAIGARARAVSDATVVDTFSDTALRAARLPVLGVMPALDGGTRWINSPPLTTAALRGKVTMIEVWTFACYNCLNALPHIKTVAAKYQSAGLITIGVHTPESDREKVTANVERRVRELGVTFPVVMDNDFAIWRAFNNRYWPAIYLVDRQGRIRFHHDGEGAYGDIDSAVRALLAE
jgi:thiol-disulfide isomerase/thioredoxin